MKDSKVDYARAPRGFAHRLCRGYEPRVICYEPYERLRFRALTSSLQRLHHVASRTASTELVSLFLDRI